MVWFFCRCGACVAIERQGKKWWCVGELIKGSLSCFASKTVGLQSPNKQYDCMLATRKILKS